MSGDLSTRAERLYQAVLARADETGTRLLILTTEANRIGASEHERQQVLDLLTRGATRTCNG
jgi:hypothetical protein